MIEKYESLASDLLEWIEQTIIILNNRKFANSLVGVQQQLQAFNTYRTVEKPPKWVSAGHTPHIIIHLNYTFTSFSTDSLRRATWKCFCSLSRARWGPITRKCTCHERANSSQTSTRWHLPVFLHRSLYFRSCTGCFLCWGGLIDYPLTNTFPSTTHVVRAKLCYSHSMFSNYTCIFIHLLHLFIRLFTCDYVL